MQILIDNPIIVVIGVFFLAAVHLSRPKIVVGGPQPEESSILLWLVMVILFLVGGLALVKNSAGISHLLPYQEASVPTLSSSINSDPTTSPGNDLSVSPEQATALVSPVEKAETQKKDLASVGEIGADTPPHGHPTAATKSGKEYMLRLALFKERKNADDEFERLSTLYSNLYMAVTGGDTYHIGIGPFETERSARNAKTRMGTKTYLVTFEKP